MRHAVKTPEYFDDNNVWFAAFSYLYRNRHVINHLFLECIKENNVRHPVSVWIKKLV
jgi:hypothetical protein